MGLTERARDGGGGEWVSLRGLVTAVGVSGVDFHQLRPLFHQLRPLFHQLRALFH